MHTQPQNDTNQTHVVVDDVNKNIVVHFGTDTLSRISPELKAAVTLVIDIISDVALAVANQVAPLLVRIPLVLAGRLAEEILIFFDVFKERLKNRRMDLAIQMFQNRLARARTLNDGLRLAVEEAAANEFLKAMGVFGPQSQDVRTLLMSFS